MGVIYGGRQMVIPDMGLRVRAPRSAAAGVNWATWFDHLWIAKGAASLSASYTDLIGSQTLTTGAAPTLDGDGWIFNGISQYLDTEIVPDIDTSFAIRFSNFTGADSADCIMGEEWTWFCPGWWGNVNYRRGIMLDPVPPAMTAGVLFSCRAAGYRNGAQDTTWTAGNPYGSSLTIGAKNFGGTISQFAPCKVQMVGISHGVLGAVAVAEASAAMAAL